MNTTILQGVVGSHAYGLNRADSDVDRLAVFVAPTVEVAGLNWTPHKESKVNQGPVGDDFASHEVGKYVRLALKVNPTITELLWLDSYEVMNDTGFDLVNMREEFLSETYVRNAYLGYAHSQLEKFENHAFKPKHARHVLRLLRQGARLLSTGRLEVKVPEKDRQLMWDFDDMDPGAVLDILTQEFSAFNSLDVVSPLPEEPNRLAAEEFIRRVRLTYI